jgi:dihydroneopterin aldolase
LFSSSGRFTEIAGFIEIRNFSFNCIIGILPHERIKPQPLVLNLCLGIDVKKLRNSNLGQSLDYSVICDQLREYIIAKQFILLEDLAEDCTQFLYSSHPLLLTLELKVEKPEALAGLATPAYLRLSKKTDFDL